MDYTVIIDNLPLYLSGLWVTIQLVVLALVTGFGLAVPLALLAVSKNSLLRYPAKAYIYFFSWHSVTGADVHALSRYGSV